MGNQVAFAKATICLSVISLLLLASCSPASHIRDDDRSTPTIRPEATSTSCPSVTPYPAVTASPSKLVFVLVDKSKSYQQWTRPALVRFAEVLPFIISPGDELVVAWVGSDSEDPTEVFFDKRAPDVSPPEIEAPPPFPVLIPTPTVHPTPTYPPGGLTTIQQLEYQRACESIRVASEQETASIEEQNDLATNDYYCALQSWNAAYEDATRAWEGENEHALQAFAYQASETLKTVDIGGYDDWTHIDEALWVASCVLQGNIANERFEGHKLIVFSDMQDDRLGDRHELPLDFAEVDVVVAMFYCREAHQCEAERNTWIGVFDNAGAQSITFLLVAESTPDRLASALR